MSRRGENIHKRKDGRWEGRYTVLTGRGKKTYSVYARSYGEIKKKLAMKKETANSEYNDRGSFQETAGEWLQDICAKRKYSTYIKYQEIYSKYLSELNQLKMDELSQEVILKKLTLLNARDSKTLKDSAYSILNQIIKYGNKRSGYDHPLFSWEKESAKKTAVEIFNHSEQYKLICVLCRDTDVMKKGILICLNTGLRLGEICALKWSDIDLKMSILHVNATVQRIAVKGQKTKTILYEGKPKSIYSVREIPLSEDTVNILKSIKPSGDYILKGKCPVEPRTYENKLKKYLEQAGIKNRNFHALRHTFATNCIESGMDVKSLSEILGHADVQITLNRYVHPSIETKRQHMNNLSAIYGQFYGQNFEFSNKIDA